METETTQRKLDFSTKPVAPGLWGNILLLNLQLIFDRQVFKEGWSVERAENAITGYRYFLIFTQLFISPVAPTGDIDAVWHSHILHSNKYAIDCQKLFGHFLHHLPKPAKLVAITNGSECSSPCCNKSDCCNDNPAIKQQVNKLFAAMAADCGEPIPDGCVNIGGSPDFCSGTTSDDRIMAIDYDNPNMAIIKAAIPFEKAYEIFINKN